MDDEELAESIRNDDAPEAPAEAPAPPRATSRSGSAGMPAWTKITIVFGLLGGGVALLLFGTASDVFVYSKLVDEVMTEPDRYVDRELRVEGQLLEGSVQFDSEPSCEHRFTLTRSGHQMPVRFPRCVVPDTFRDDMEIDVVVQGQLQANGTFLANEVIPRCPSKYEMRQRQQDGEAMPHAMPAPGETS